MTDLTPEQAARETCPFCKGIGASVEVDAIHPDGHVENPRPAVCMVCNGEGTVETDALETSAPTIERTMILSAYYDQTTALCDLVYGTEGDAPDGAAEFHAELNAALADAYEDGKGNLVDLLDTERIARQEAERERDNHARTLYAEGYSPCATAECNCGGWHGGHVAELRARLRNVARTLVAEVGAGGPMNAEAAAERAVAVILGLREERDEARREIDASRAHVIALEQQNVALLRWQSVASDAHVDHLCAIIRSLAVSDETPRVLRDLSADGVESEIRRAFKAERINREKSEAAAMAARKERDDMSGQMLDERNRANEWLSLLHDLRNVAHRGLAGDATSADIEHVMARVDAALVRS